MRAVWVASVLAVASMLACGRRDGPVTDQNSFHGAFLDALSGSDWVYKVYVVEPQTARPPDTDLWPLLTERLPSLRKETYESWRSSNERGRPVAPEQRGRMKVHVLSSSESADLAAAARDGRLAQVSETFRARYPDSVQVGLSAPGFSRDQMQALMYYRERLEYRVPVGYYYLLEWQEGRWVIAETHMVWE